MIGYMYSNIERYIKAKCTITIGLLQTNSSQAFLWDDKPCDNLCSLSDSPSPFVLEGLPRDIELQSKASTCNVGLDPR